MIKKLGQVFACHVAFRRNAPGRQASRYVSASGAMAGELNKTGVAGFGISLLVHGAIIVGFLVGWGPASGPVDKAKESPEAILQPIVDPLDVDPMSYEQLEQELVDKPAAGIADLTTVLQVPQEAVPASQSAESIAVVSKGYSNAGQSQGRYVGKQTYQSSFCGTRGSANRICFVVDCSGSMVIAFDYVRNELKGAIGKLGPGQYFNVIFFAGGNPKQLSPKGMLRAGAASRQKAMSFIASKEVRLTSVSDSTAAWQGVVGALQEAFAAKGFDGSEVQLIYLLTDGEYDHQQVLQAVKRMQDKRKYPAVINVIACGNRDNEEFLRNLAETYNGQYRFVSDEQLAHSGNEYRGF